MPWTHYKSTWQARARADALPPIARSSFVGIRRSSPIRTVGRRMRARERGGTVIVTALVNLTGT
jgi:hypothetical protein